MGMSIDEALENLHAIQDYYNDDMEDNYMGFAKEDNESVDVAINTMRKYQKIEQIIRNYDTTWEFHTLRGTVDKIREVIEDGSN